jgi:hypothetical protein
MRTAGLLALIVPAACARAPAEAACPELEPGELVVTEIRSAQDPEDPAGSWIEIFNSSGHTVDLIGIRLGFRRRDEDTATTTALVRRRLEAAPGSFTVLGLFDDAEPPSHVHYGLLDDFVAETRRSWVAPGVVAVETCGVLVDQAVYERPAAGTYSLGGIPDANRNDLGTAWCNDATQVGATSPGTPKSPNIACP